MCRFEIFKIKLQSIINEMIVCIEFDDISRNIEKYGLPYIKNRHWKLVAFKDNNCIINNDNDLMKLINDNITIQNKSHILKLELIFSGNHFSQTQETESKDDVTHSQMLNHGTGQIYSFFL